MTRSFPFSEQGRAEIVETCKSIAASGRAWHIHALHPGCAFNPRPELYCFVVEDTDAGQTYCAFSKQSFVRECQELVQLLHGESILDAGQSDDAAKSEPIVQSVHEACRTGEAWHHHMMKPGCVLSTHRDCHVITLEREKNAEIETLVSDEPLDDILREIELMYFKKHD